MRGRVLFISNIAWDFVWQRHQSLAYLFARDADVAFCEVPGIRRVGWRDIPRIFARLRRLREGGRTITKTDPVKPGIRLLRPFVLPATNALFCALNARLLDRFLAREATLRRGVDLVVNYSPAHTALQLLDRVPHRRLVYDCTDDWLAVQGIPEFLPDDESALLARADLTMVPSRRLEEFKRGRARRLARVPHGAFVERFLVDPLVHAPGDPLTLLYYGHLHAQHLDFTAIDTLARARPAWRVILVGPVKTPHAFPSNVVLPGQQPHEQLRDFVRSADLLLLPYAVNEYTRAVLPAKIYECLATGRPIVSSPLPDLKADFSAYLRFASRPTEWAESVELALRDDSPAARDSRIEIARENTWECRYGQICGLLAELSNASITG
jgi:glycosyltransferase involved in cell wall biosynthesis